MTDIRISGTGNGTSRREFLKNVGGVAVLSTAGISAMEAGSAELPELDESDPTAVALKYVHDASSVAESLRPKKHRYCYNCTLYAGSDDDAWAACAIFPGKAVAGPGWCGVWAPR